MRNLKFLSNADVCIFRDCLMIILIAQLIFLNKKIEGLRLFLVCPRITRILAAFRGVRRLCRLKKAALQLSIRVARLCRLLARIREIDNNQKNKSRRCRIPYSRFVDKRCCAATTNLPLKFIIIFALHDLQTRSI
jgi:hypothetical protein